MGDNPNWKPFLDKLPESLHELIKPVLMEWDQGVNAKLEAERTKYAPYKAFVDNSIDADAINQALQVADLIRENPKLVIDRINEAHQLGYLDKDTAAQLSQHTNNEVEDDLEFDGVNIEQHPKFQALMQQVEQINSTLTEQQKKDLEDQQQVEFENYIKGLHDEHGEFDDEIVMAYMAYGDLDGPAAIEKYRTKIASHLTPPNENQQQNQQGQEQATNVSSTSPPVVLDGNPAGSGSEQQIVDYSSLKKNEMNDLVAKMLEAAAQNNQ